ncbi:MAG: ATPase [Planctomycetota bacterium]|nr:MAG: ATPase [Planctomycetota bacterium]
MEKVEIMYRFLQPSSSSPLPQPQSLPHRATDRSTIWSTSIQGPRNRWSRAMIVAGLVACMIGQSASADVTDTADHGFRLRIVRQVNAPAAALFERLVMRFDAWWSPEHSYSGDAANFRMDLAEGWLVERLRDGGWVRHMAVAYYQPDRTLRLLGGLGPLQELGCHGALTFTLEEQQPQATQLVVTYHVIGFVPGGLQSIAPSVDQVLQQQVDRLIAPWEPSD